MSEAKFRGREEGAQKILEESEDSEVENDYDDSRIESEAPSNSEPAVSEPEKIKKKDDGKAWVWWVLAAVIVIVVVVVLLKNMGVL